MSAYVITGLIVLWGAVTTLLVWLIRKWYIQKDVPDVKRKSEPRKGGQTPADDLKDMIEKSRAIMGFSSAEKGSLQEKIGEIDVDVFVSGVKTWLKEADRDKLEK
ncbi:hypothetical protein MNBD_NITROSPINAE02-535 [hydrothermal vent metagenome]|uniref:Uncharacterized protein n=1 Tax=hydrothermal vent metagenome TaxID=652676 RepID=A0A3B1BTD1_9ZZZZ